MLKSMQILQQEWLCPINKAPMKQPVLTIDGHTYQKSAIQTWLQTSNKSPKTGLSLSQTILIPNIALKNLKQKIISHLSVCSDRNNQLETQNRNLVFEVTQLREELSHLQAKFQQQLQMTKKQQKLKKMQQKMVNSKKNQVQYLRRTITQLEDKLKQANKKQTSNKYQSDKLTEQYQWRIKQLILKQKKKNQQCQKSKNQLQAKYKKIVQQIQTQVNDFILMISSMLSVLNKMKKVRNPSLKKNIIQVQENMLRAVKSNQSISDQAHLNKFQILCNIVSVLNLEPKYFRQIGYCIKTYLCEKANFYTVKYVMSYKVFEALFIKHKAKTRISLSVIQSIDDMYDHEDFLDSDWNKFISLSKKLTNLQIIDLQFNQIKQVRKEHLSNFPKLLYINLQTNPLSVLSKLNLEEYQRQNPSIIVKYDQVSVNLSNNQSLILSQTSQTSSQYDTQEGQGAY